MKEYTEQQVEELAAEIGNRVTTGRYFKRVQAVYCLALGDSYCAVGVRASVSERTVRNYESRYFAEGLKGLRSKNVGSNNRKLTFEQEAEALDKLSKTADLGEYARSKELAVEFEKLSGASYHINAFRALLKRHGWRKVAPRGAHPKKATDEAIEM